MRDAGEKRVGEKKVAARPPGGRLGAKVRALRRKESLSQAQMALRLGISASYLNLIENDRRPLPATVLLRLGQEFGIELQSFAGSEDQRLVADLLEAFSDPLFEAQPLNSADVRELAQSSPQLAQAMLALYHAWQGARRSAESLASELDLQDLTGVGPSHLPSEEVSDLIQKRMNYFAELEEGAERLWSDARLSADDLHGSLMRYLGSALGVHVKLVPWAEQPGTLRRYDPARKALLLSELLPTRSRTFQLAHQIGLLTQREALDALCDEAALTSSEARTLARVALANYFAAAVMMPYEAFRAAAEAERYDIDVLGRRFRVGFEQVCQRLTTLRRPGKEGVAFHMIRIDVAGNISKRFSASGIRFARFSGVCPRWNIFAAFQTPGMIRIQVSKMPDGEVFFCIARTVQRDAGGYHDQHPVMAIGLGCKVEEARRLVYADGVDFGGPGVSVPVGVSCRICERTDCDQRAMASMRQALRLDENVRGVSLYVAAR
ncbi:MAG: short-chain fatty acyl-CoA regulator family protein [Myxococcota bacterium]